MGVMVIEPGERHVVVDDGAALWTTVSGRGPVVVACHGGPGLWDYLGDLADLLEDSRTVIRYDQRGCGRSGGAEGPFTLERAIADLDQLRTALGVEAWAVLGHSWGAELALRYAIAHPERTTAAVYLGGVGAGEGWRGAHQATSAARLGEDLARWRHLSTKSRTIAEEREWCLLSWRPDFAPGPEAEEHARALWATRPAGASINAAANRGLWAEQLDQPLLVSAAGLQVPVTMIHGDQDPRPAWANDDLHAALPHAHRAIVAGAGHAPWVERPDEVQRLVLTALRAPPPHQLEASPGPLVPHPEVEVSDERGRTGPGQAGRDLTRNPDVVVREEEVVSESWHVLRRTTFDIRRRDGTWTTRTRDIYDTGDAATILLHDAARASVLLVRQFRLPAYAGGHRDGMLIETAAGALDGQDPTAAIRREAAEELGVHVGQLTHVFDAYMSPGSTTQRLHFYAAPYTPAERTGPGGGIGEEGEDIEALEVAFTDALAMVRDGRITDAKTIMLLQWAALEGPFSPDHQR